MAETKYIFVTGGVVSSLGKGIISSSIGKLLQARGYNVTIQKFDPYINIDPGTLNPYEHGECYVTVDGMETDLDLGHYERFTGIQTTKANSLTTGRIYKAVIDKERRGDYLGKTIQVVPHITDEIKRNVKYLGKKEHYDFVITEIGGTIGDIESAPYMEAIRQLKWELGRNAVNIHLTYVPYLHAAGELKTKPTQHSVKELQSVGIQPDVLVLRTEKHLSDQVRKKVAAFCNVDFDCVIQSEDLPSIYEVPVNMQNQGLDTAILRKVGIEPGEKPGLGPWRAFLERRNKATKEVTIGLVGKYDLQDAYKSIRESLSQAGVYNDHKTVLKFINSEYITEDNVAEKLAGVDGIVVCPGFGQRGIEGKIVAAHYTRTHDIPTFGICLGMQMMVVEFGRNVLGYADANSREMDEKTPHNVIDIMEEQKNITNMGGTTPTWVAPCVSAPTSVCSDRAHACSTSTSRSISRSATATVTSSTMSSRRSMSATVCSVWDAIPRATSWRSWRYRRSSGISEHSSILSTSRRCSSPIPSSSISSRRPSPTKSMLRNKPLVVII